MKTVKEKYIEAWKMLDEKGWDYFRCVVNEKELNYNNGEVWEAFLRADEAYIEFSNILQRKAEA